MARPKKYTDKEIADALRQEHGMVTRAAKRIGCSAQAIYNRMEKSKAIQDAKNEAHETLGDAVETALADEAINKRNVAALIFLAKTKFKERGYVERQEVAHDGTLDVNIQWTDYNASKGND